MDFNFLRSNVDCPMTGFGNYRMSACLNDTGFAPKSGQASWQDRPLRAISGVSSTRMPGRFKGYVSGMLIGTELRT
jgi:hypothetical protein